MINQVTEIFDSSITPSLKLTTADATAISNTSLEINIYFALFSQTIWLKASFGFCLIPSKHRDNKLSSCKSKNIDTSRSWITFDKLTDNLQSSLQPFC